MAVAVFSRLRGTSEKPRAFGVAALLVLLACGPAVDAQSPGTDAGSEPQLETVSHGIPHDAIYDMTIAGDYGVAVGAYGTILESQDSGATWKKTESPKTVGLLGVAVSGEHRIIVGQQGTVLLGKEGGGWTVASGAPDARLLSVAMNAAGLTVAVGEFGTVIVSKDFGQSWQKVTSLHWEEFNDEGYEPHIYDAAITDSGEIFIVGEFGLILVSADQGASWEARHRGEESLFALHLGTNVEDAGFAVGQDGAVLRTSDQGKTWNVVKADTDANLLGVWSGNGEVVVTGIREMLRSSDNGETWTVSKDVGVTRNWYQPVVPGVVEVAAGKGFLRQQVIYIAGYEGTISRVLY